MKHIKTNIDNIDISKLRSYLIDKKNDYFDYPMNKATSWEDFERFPNYDCNRNRLITYGEHLMVVFRSQLWICKHTKRKYVVDGRRIQFKPIYCVVEDCHKLLGSRWSGYWLIPNPNYVEPKKIDLNEFNDYIKNTTTGYNKWSECKKGDLMERFSTNFFDD